MISLELFKAYLEFRGYVASAVSLNSKSFNATIFKSYKPDASHFSKFTYITNCTQGVQLDFSDLNNEDITGGFFNKENGTEKN